MRSGINHAGLLGTLTAVVFVLLCSPARAGGDLGAAIDGVISRMEELMQLPPNEIDQRILARFFTPLIGKLEDALEACQGGDLKGALGRISGVVLKLDKAGLLSGIILGDEVDSLLFELLDRAEQIAAGLRIQVGPIAAENPKAARLLVKLASAEAALDRAETALFEESDLKTFLKEAKSASAALGGIQKALAKFAR